MIPLLVSTVAVVGRGVVATSSSTGTSRVGRVVVGGLFFVLVHTIVVDIISYYIYMLYILIFIT